MNRRLVCSTLLVCCIAASAGTLSWSLQKKGRPSVTAAATAWMETLDDDQKKVALMGYDAKERLGWHFIPKDERKGLQVKNMTGAQRKAAMGLLRSSLSQAGFKKARTIMKLEALLKELEKGRTGGPIRDHQRYYFTIFGTPGKERWGLSMEGHHLSLNFVLEGEKVVSSTPAFFAANPAVVKNGGAGVKEGTRVLGGEELLAFELVNALDEEQRAEAILDPKAPREIRAAGEPQPPTDAAEGIAVAKLNDKQKAILHKLIEEYANAMPAKVAKERLSKIEEAGPNKVHFAWAGATKPGVGHYYRIQGPTFLIEFVNTQPDAAGNPANHIHCVWRDMAGDFALPIQ